jgi:hypothetical protein
VVFLRPLFHGLDLCSRVLVGRGFLPGADSALTDLKTQAARLQEMVARSKRGEQGSQAKETIDETLAFYEKLESKKDEAKKKAQNLSTSKEGTKQGTLEQAKGDLSRKNGTCQGGDAEARQWRTLNRAPGGQRRFHPAACLLEEKAKAETMVRNLISKGHDAYFYEVTGEGKDLLPGAVRQIHDPGRSG